MSPRNPLHLPFVAIALALATVLGIARAGLAADIEVRVLHFGTGDVARGAGPIALQCEFRSSIDRVVEVEAALEVPNADLDIVEHSRSFVLNPGQAQRRWIYANLPPLAEGTLGSEIFDLRLYEVADGERVRDLGTARLTPSIAENPPRVVGLEQDLLLVVGSRSAGLDIYGQASSSGTNPAMNALTSVALARDIDAFPDRWEGFAPFDAVVWSSGSVVPSRLAEESVRALLHWTERGGNLVIALPAASDPWSIGTEGRHGFSSVLPSVAPRRVEDVRVADLLPVLSLSRSLRSQAARTRLALFDPATLDRGYRPFLALPAARSADGAPTLREGSIDGGVYAVRRAYGFGFITILGIDVDELSASGLQTPSLPQGDVFWNRILGRRADTPGGAEFAALDKAERLAANSGYSRTIGDGGRVAEEIGLAGQAAIGVLAAAGVFGLYWLVAGPFGFAVLKAWKRERWAWVAYLAVAIVFALGIWLVGGSLSGAQARIDHFTVLDMVARAPGEGSLTEAERKRATGWLSLYSPSYGTVEVALDPSGDATLRNSLASWRAAGNDVTGFPSRERYTVPVDGSSRIELPSRATSIDLETRWLGGIASSWGEMPSATAPVGVRIDRAVNPATVEIDGTLVHRLPATLRDVVLVHIWPVRNPAQTLNLDSPPTRRFPDQLPNRGAMVVVPSWAPGETLDLARVLPPQPISDRLGLERTISERYYAPIYRSASQLAGGFGLAGDDIDLTRGIEMLSLYGMLQPPPYLRNPPQNPEILRIARKDMRELDLSTRFAEPCLMVVGSLEAVPLPYPVEVDGAAVPSEGRVVVRWILPLPADWTGIVPEKSIAPSLDGERVPSEETETKDSAVKDGASER